MTSDDLTREQLEKVQATVGRQLRYLNRLLARMQRLGFPPGDTVLIAAIRAQAEAQGLRMALHYAACKNGVGRPENL